MEINHILNEAATERRTRLEHDLARYRQAKKYIKLMGGPLLDFDSGRSARALDPSNDSLTELRARYRVIDAAERWTLRMISDQRESGAPHKATLREPC